MPSVKGSGPLAPRPTPKIFSSPSFANASASALPASTLCKSRINLPCSLFGSTPSGKPSLSFNDAMPSSSTLVLVFKSIISLIKKCM